MNRTKLGGYGSHLALACAAAALLAGCNRANQTAATTAPPLDALPLTTDAGPAAALAPAASALPSARPARMARLARPEQGYAYLDRAYAASDGYAGTPPDYAVDYDGERPWIWRGGDDSERVVERTPQGLRYYYYEPGASEPYLIQDPDYGYAYSDGQLVALYGPDGRIEPYEVEQRRLSQAGRYLAWAAGLYAASLHQQRQAVQRDHWLAQQNAIANQRAAWAEQQTRYQDWNTYHQAHAQEEAAHWAPERNRRQAELVRYGAPQGPQGGQAAAYPAARYQGGGDPEVGNQRGPQQGERQDARYQGGGFGRPDGGPLHTPGQANALPPGYPGAPPSGYRHDPADVRGDAAQAEPQAQAQRRAGFEQRPADVQAQRQQVEQAHAAQMQAMQAQQSQAHAAEAQRQATLQRDRMSEQAQRQAAQQAHAAQMQAMSSQRMQARAAEGERQATLQQARMQQQAQQRVVMQAHAAQVNAARAQAESGRQAAMQQAQAADAQRRAAEEHGRAAQAQAEQQARMAQAQHAPQPHPGGPSHQDGPHQGGPHGDPHGDRGRHGPDDQR